MTTEASLAVQARSPADDADIRETIANYYLGWYDGDPDRMARALHADLVKRGWLPASVGNHELRSATYTEMVGWTREGLGRRADPDEWRYTVTALEVHGDIASACVHAVPYVDYLHLVRTRDGWRILGALWCRP
jgi:hypothetical protein